MTRPPDAKLFVARGTLVVLLASAVVALAGEAARQPAADKSLTITAGADWLPLEVNLDIVPGSALDFSRVVPRHAPAGKFGRMVVTGQGKFAFENCSTPARFYGVDLCCTAQFLPHELADRLAERLVRLGYNTVRIHHHERWLTGPGAVRFNAQRLDQLDYLFAALKQRGIYVTTDLYVSRLVAVADIFGGPSATPPPASTWTFENYYNVGPANIGVQDYKMAVFINDQAYENYQAFARAFLDHRNPYTRLRYADDPALAWLSLMNEDCPGNFAGGLKGRLREEWQRAWNRWLAARYPDRVRLAAALGNLAADQDPARGTVPLAAVRGPSPSAVEFNRFLADVELRFYHRTRKFVRDEMRCQALLTDCNGWTNPVQLQAVRNEFDFVDDHFYVDHPDFWSPLRQPPSRCPNVNPIGGTACGVAAAFTRLLDKPLTITEFNYCGPGQFRGMGGALTGALAALQDWDGLWRHPYSYSQENITRPAAMYYFDLAADPLNQAAERAALCLFLRGDLQPAKHAVAITATADDLLQRVRTACDKTPPWGGLAWLARVGWRIGTQPSPAPDLLPLAFPGGPTPLFAAGQEAAIVDALRQRNWLPAANRADFEKYRFESPGRELTVDAAEHTLTVDTPRTAGGFAPAGKRIQTRAATIEIHDADATLWISSLDGEPIADSRRLLITHLTDLQNTGTRFADHRRQVLLAWGQLPHLVRAGRAQVTLRIKNAQRATVHALAVNGKRAGEIGADAAGDALSIPLSVAAGGKARMLYEVEIGR